MTKDGIHRQDRFEQREVVESFNATEAEFPKAMLLHELFERQVQRAPQALAVMYRNESLTFSQVNERANRLARHLRHQGIGPDRRVGLCIQRSVDMIVAILGIWKAGGAYVPLDPDYPQERLAQILDDAAPAVILTQHSLQERLVTISGAIEIIALDSHWPAIAANPAGDLDSREFGLRSDQLAYVIFTSGSTGRPKGVMIEHRNVMSLWQGLEHIYGQSARCERIGVNASFNFDASVKQLIQMLSGRTLVLIPQEVRLDATKLLEHIDEQRLDGIDCTPSQLRAWLDAGLLDKETQRLSVVLIGGESIDSALWTRLAARTGTDFYNVYGPTESTVDTTFARITVASEPNIGKPMENRRVYVLDRQQQPVPIGVAGELWIGGAGIARGYLNRPELTDERFWRDPFSADPQARLYRSGDVGKWRSDGTIEYLGRNDDQVKIRGVRIELGEIEAQLSRHSQVKEVAVVAREDIPGEKRLVAYLTTRDGTAPTVDELRTQLRNSLPEHMLPSAFVTLESMPLSPNGKLDRRALPPPELDAYTNKPYAPPQGETEAVVANLWRDLLRLERVGRHDNFLELGGHSLLIAQMLTRLSNAGLITDFSSAFKSPSLADFAASLRSGAASTFEVPPRRIPEGCRQLSPDMLPLVNLDSAHLETITHAVLGGAANIQDIYPLAPLQEGMLFHCLLDEQRGGSYVLPLLLSVSSAVQLHALLGALQSIVDRHDALRTAVLWEQLPQPVQVVYRRAVLPVEQIQLARHDELLDQWLGSESDGIDVREAPLLRVQVAPDPADPQGSQWLALLRIHHLVSDNESLDLLLAEVSAQLGEQAPQLPEPIPYRNHVAWALAQARSDEAQKFFSSRLGDVEETTAPFGLTDVHSDAERILEAWQSLPTALAVRTRAQAKRLGVSPATLFHAAWGVLIAHASGRDDVVFGTVLLGRLQGVTAGRRALGMYINTLPLRLRLDALNVKDLIKQTHAALADLVSHEQTSLALAQRCSGVAASAPLFSALLNYRHSSGRSAGPRAIAPGIQILAMRDRTNYPFTLSVDESSQGFGIAIKTDRQLDPRQVLGYFSNTMQSLLDALEHRPQLPALALSILSEAERREVVESFNATEAEFPKAMLLHELFERQVQRAPQALAAVYQDDSLTFSQVNERANRLARHLRHQGIGPDRRVGLCIQRSVDMIVAMLGIWKAGGAYVPLDPDYPQERLAQILGDAAPAVILTQHSLQERLVTISGAIEIIALDSHWPAIAANPAGDLDPREFGLRSDHLAYVIFTSGSTGRPKGVMIEHRNVMSLWQGLEYIYGQSARCERIGVNASFNFDASVKQLIQVLSGRTLVLIPQEVRLDATKLLEHIDEQRLDGIDCTPSQLRAWLDAGLLDKETQRLSVVLIGGESIDSALWSRLAACTGTDFYNVYGPTESTVDTTSARITVASAPNIGKPMENRRVYVLDHQQQPAPIGVAGELWIGGAGIARGYLNRPELTDERFWRDPFSADPQARLYRSGDVGKWRSDGTIEYLGRNDDQVKIRGFRIELGEIEAQLARHEQIKQAAVVARPDASGESSLVAFVTTRGSSPSIETLRAHLRAALPDHMIPSAFVVKETLPLTPNGKIDRRELRQLELAIDTSARFEAPSGEVEQILASIWQRTLSKPGISRHDNFFLLGGHSLSAMQMIVRIRSTLSLDVAIGLLFQHPVLHELSTAVEAQLDRQLREQMAGDEGYADHLLEELAAMPESQVHRLMTEMTTGDQA